MATSPTPKARRRVRRTGPKPLGDSHAPRGKEAVQRALLDAAAELFAEQGPARVGVRDIADRAGVNHGLVHRHFGSKEGLLKATLDGLAEQIYEDAASLGGTEDAPISDTGDLIQRLLDTFEAVEHHPVYFRVLARSLLDGYEPEQLQSAFPLVARLITVFEHARAQKLLPAFVEPKMAVALMVASALGWLMFEPYVLSATGQRNLSTRARQRRRLETWRALAAAASSRGRPFGS